MSYKSNTTALIAAIARAFFAPPPVIGFNFPSKKSMAEEKTALIKELAELEVDPEMFDVLLANELDRKLKAKFGTYFLVLTCIFTAASYGVIILNGIYDWGISNIAITALVIETPLQFIGLLYIIARNLFPQNVNKINPSM